LYLDQTHADFKGIKIGDVNENASANLHAGPISGSRSLTSTDVYFADKKYAQGEEFTIELDIEDDLLGMQMGVILDNASLEVITTESTFPSYTVGNWKYTDKGLLTMSWNDLETTGNNTISITVKAKTAGVLSDNLELAKKFNSELYASDLTASEIKLVARGEVIEETSEFVVLQNTPNPFAKNTVVEFYTPKNTRVDFAISDLSGKTIYSSNDQYTKGNHQIRIDRSNIGLQSGIYYYSVTFEGNTITKKMVLVN